MPPAGTDVDAQIVAVLMKTRLILHADTKFLADHTNVTQKVVEAALHRLQTGGRVQVDTEGHWKLV